MGKDHVGTSAFSHQDDSTADIHPSTIEGAKHLFYGEPMTPKHELQEIVVGPPPFGSPDPRTLGHRMIPLTDEPASAPELDADWVARNRVAQSGQVDDDQLDKMNKSELKQLAEARGVEIDSDAKKDEIKQAIVDHQQQNQPNQDEGTENTGNQDNEGSGSQVNTGFTPGIEQGTTGQQGQGLTAGASQGEGGQQQGQSTNYHSMNKAELLQLANERNINVDESDSKADIVEALQESDNTP